MSDLTSKEYEKCFVYQCLTSVCHGASLDGEKYRKVCLDCPCFRNWLHDRRKKEMHHE